MNLSNKITVDEQNPNHQQRYNDDCLFVHHIIIQVSTSQTIFLLKANTIHRPHCNTCVQATQTAQHSRPCKCNLYMIRPTSITTLYHRNTPYKELVKKKVQNQCHTEVHQYTRHGHGMATVQQNWAALFFHHFTSQCFTVS